MGKKLYVGNISFKASEGDIKELFTTIGEVESIKLITDAQTGHKKGFGFIEMSSVEEARKAMSDLNGATLLDKSIVVNEARERKGPRRDQRRHSGRSGSGKSRESHNRH